MAGRKPKKGLDWFPMRTNVFTDPKIMDIIQNGDADAWTVFTSVLILTYNEGYYSDREAIVRAIAWIFRGLSRDRIEECLDMLVDAGLLDKSAFEKGALTSHGIQSHYETVVKRRVDNADTKYWIDSVDKNSISANNNSISAGINEEDDELMHTEMQHIRTDNIREDNRISENIREYQKREDVSDSSDSFQSSFSDSVIDRLSSYGVDVKRNTLQLIDEMLRKYDPRSVDEAVDMAIAGYRSGEVRSVIGYMKTVLENWANGKGCPKWVEREEMALAEQKKEYMCPGALAKELMTTRKLE